MINLTAPLEVVSIYGTVRVKITTTRSYNTKHHTQIPCVSQVHNKDFLNVDAGSMCIIDVMPIFYVTNIGCNFLTSHLSSELQSTHQTAHTLGGERAGSGER